MTRSPEIPPAPDFPGAGGDASFYEQDITDDTRAKELGRLVLSTLSSVEPERLEWLWPGRIPRGKLTLIAGDPGLGKSLITIDMAARVTRGLPWPDSPDAPSAAGTVILLSAEDDLADTIRPRLDAADADADRVVSVNGVEEIDHSGRRGFNLERDVHLLDILLDLDPDTRLVVIDPITAYCGKTDSHKNADIRWLLAPLAELAARRHVAVVAVTHLSKTAGAKALYRAMGSLAFVAAARAAWAVVADPDDHDRRLMLPLKQNLGPESNGLAFGIVSVDLHGVGSTPQVAWEPDPVTTRVDEVLAAEIRRDRDADGGDEAAEWLQEALSEGPLPAKEVKRQAAQNAVSAAQLRRARKALNVKTRRIGFGKDGTWWWLLPGQNVPGIP